MKTGLRIFRMHIMVSLALCLSMNLIFAQDLPYIEARFANPIFDKTSKIYYLDVELKTREGNEALFGMNLRFYYDASKMTFKGVDDFKNGYGILGDQPKVFVGNAASGVQLFNFPRSAAFVNGAVQLLNEQNQLQIQPNTWVKAFRLTFKVPVSILDKDDFCPSVIWDLKPVTGTGGFLPGGDGLVITVVEKDRSTRVESAPAISIGIPFNWEYFGANALPYGQIAGTECVRLSTISDEQNIEHADAKGYLLNQNQPNPFDNRTMIEFTLPFAQRGSIILYDADGKIVDEIKGDFVSGKNQIVLKQKTWMQEASVMYYRLHTDHYTSKAMKMTLVRA